MKKKIAIIFLSIMVLVTNLSFAEPMLWKDGKKYETHTKQVVRKSNEYYLFDTVSGINFEKPCVVELKQGDTVFYLKTVSNGVIVLYKGKEVQIDLAEFKSKIELPNIKPYVLQKINTDLKDDEVEQSLRAYSNGIFYSFLDDDGIQLQQDSRAYKIVESFISEHVSFEKQIQNICKHLKKQKLRYNSDTVYEQISNMEKGYTACLGYNFLTAKMLNKTDIYYKTVTWLEYDKNGEQIKGHIFLIVSPDNKIWYELDTTAVGDFTIKQEPFSMKGVVLYNTDKSDIIVNISPAVRHGSIVSDSYYVELRN
ncbi:hypothetical protein [Filifactor alocis]|uniref:hypothetical protein n=1 Tax=Filifactor alocis TaxID=143361 RepID=UPI003F9FA2CF